MISRYAAERVELKVRPLSSGYVVLADLDYPGWEATVNGAPVKIQRAHRLLRAVPVPAIPGKIEFCYHPYSFRVGLWLALISLGLLATMLVLRPWLRPFDL